MKKLISLFLALTLCLSCSLAFAEATEIEVAEVENGVAVPFTDYGFSVNIPGDWNVLEVTDEQVEAGIIASFSNAENTRNFTVAYKDLGAETDLAGIQEQLAAAYTDVALLTINGMQYVSYTIADLDQSGLAFLGGEGTGMYLFVFTPSSDADFGTLATQIAGSIVALQE